MKIAALITCHNRRDKTLTCLDLLLKNSLPENVLLEVFLVDDGSSDGTGDAVRQMYPDVHVLEGGGNLYWNGGMRTAFAAAMEQGFDYYLWLNDDTFLYSNTMGTLLRVAGDLKSEQNVDAVVVGTTQAKKGFPPTHGGIKKWTRINSMLVIPLDVPMPCETMYGNCVLIPKEVAARVGNLDPAFVHSIGDVDYGLRVRAAGFPIMVMPGYAGTCDLNPVGGTCSDFTLPLKVRLSKILGPKGLPLRPWFIFLWRHFGLLGLSYGVWIYTKILILSVSVRR